MNIKILDSWLKEFLVTDATPKQISEQLSLTSVGIERVEKWKSEYLYDIEVTTNRVDLASVTGLAREAGAVLPRFGINAKFNPLVLSKITSSKKVHLDIDYDKKLVNRICFAILEIEVKQSPQKIKDRLESTGIRSLNNIIDITNYVMRTIGHPTHVFDFDKLQSNKLIIRESKKGEKITTLDGKTYSLPGGDIIATDSKGKIVDLLAIMGLENSVVDQNTKRILFFVNNNETSRIRKTSMNLGIRTEAAQLNEKGIDPEKAMEALLFGIKLYKEIANGKLISEIYDIYPNIPKNVSISVNMNHVNEVIGVEIPKKEAISILQNLGFGVDSTNDGFSVIVPSSRKGDITIEEDIIEEIARIYGYHKIPSLIPFIQPINIENETVHTFLFEQKIRNAFKYWGFTEIYSYPMVSKNMYKGVENEKVKILNPMGEDFVYMRSSLTPSLLKVISENKRKSEIKIFEIAKIYLSKPKNLPVQTLHLASVIKGENVTFFHIKGYIEQLINDLGINSLNFSSVKDTDYFTEILIKNEIIGTINVLDKNLISFEIDANKLISNATNKKTFTPLAKFPPIVEDMSFIVPDYILTGEIVSLILKQDKLIKEVTLLDKYKDSKTFHIVYQDFTKNLTNEMVAKIRLKIIATLKNKLSIGVK